ncbi:MAG: nitroreductase family protein [Planctomycetaceae bacterium]|nr:nitroreductase family protein [Planctomycetaceae bacterium]
MSEIVINKFKCVRCGQCILACPARVYTRNSPLESTVLAKDGEERCIACNHCIAICPVNAISVNSLDSSDCDFFTDGVYPRLEHIISLVQMRRSIRTYSNVPVDDSQIEQLLNAVRWAPTAKNRLPVKWLIINGRKKVVELGGLVINWFRRLKGVDEMLDAWDLGLDPIFRGAPCVVAAYTTADSPWAAVDCSIAMQTFDYCAAAMRLGTCWAGYFINVAQKDMEINKWLGLSRDEEIYASLMLGNIGGEFYQKIPPRPEIKVKWIQ